MGRDIYLFRFIAVSSFEQQTTDIHHFRLSPSCQSNSEKLTYMPCNPPCTPRLVISGLPV